MMELLDHNPIHGECSAVNVYVCFSSVGQN